MQRPLPILWSTLGVLAGFLGAHGIFAPFVSELSESSRFEGDRLPQAHQDPSPRLGGGLATRLSVVASGRQNPRISGSDAGEEEAENEVDVDWAGARASLPLRFLEDLDVRGFVTENQSPWTPEAEAFLITPELREILQLDDAESAAIREILLNCRRTETANRWTTPASLKADGEGVTIEIAPASGAVETTLQGSLIAIMGAQRTEFFLKKIRPTLDWEFGGFGNLRRVVEVSVLPDNTLSIRESLREAKGGASAPSFEVQSRQFRVQNLPSPIAALVEIEE